MARSSVHARNAFQEDQQGAFVHVSDLVPGPPDLQK